MFLFKPLFIRFRHGDLEGYFVRNDLKIPQFYIRILCPRVFYRSYKMSHFCSELGSTASVFSLVALSVDRNMAVSCFRQVKLNSLCSSLDIY